MGYYRKDKDSIDLLAMLVVFISLTLFSQRARIERVSSSVVDRISWSTTGQSSTEALQWINKNRIDSVAINLIKKSEGFNPKWKKCPKGIQSIGYGFTRMKWKSKMTKPIADSILLVKYNQLQLDIQKALGTTKVKDNQLAALTVFSYNVGFNAFLESRVLRCIRNNKSHRIKEELNRWVYIKSKGKVVYLKGLKQRRMKEYELWKMELS